jgi:hypothetical protein
MDEVGREMELPFVPEVQRNLMQSMKGGHDLVGIPGLAVEVKFQENPQVEKWWEQATVQADRVKLLPVLIHRKKNAKWRVRMWAVLPGNFEINADFSMDEFLFWFRNHLMEAWTAHPPGLRRVLENRHKEC